MEKRGREQRRGRWRVGGCKGIHVMKMDYVQWENPYCLKVFCAIVIRHMGTYAQNM